MYQLFTNIDSSGPVPGPDETNHNGLRKQSLNTS